MNKNSLEHAEKRIDRVEDKLAHLNAGYIYLCEANKAQQKVAQILMDQCEILNKKIVLIEAQTPEDRVIDSKIKRVIKIIFIMNLLILVIVLLIG